MVGSMTWELSNIDLRVSMICLIFLSSSGGFLCTSKITLVFCFTMAPLACCIRPQAL